MVASTPVGKVVTVEVIRQGQKRSLQVKIGELKGEEEPREAGEAKGGPQLGMRVEQLTPEIARYLGLSESKGIVVVDVEAGSPAAEAGVQPGDIILEIDQYPVKDLKQFNQKIKAYRAGETILMLIKRKGATLYLTLKVGE